VSAYLDRLFDEYRRAAKAGQDVMDAAATENRDLSPEEQETRDKAFAAVTDLKAEIDKVTNFEKLREAGDAFRAVATPVVERATGKAPTDGDLFRAMLATGGAREFRPSDAVLNSREHPDLMIRALQATGGGSAVQTSFADFVTVYERTYTPMLNPSVVGLLNRSDGAPLVLPRVTADTSVAGTITAEAGGITEGDPTISAITLNPYKYAVTNLWSAELAQDNTIGVEDLIARTTGRSLAIAIGGALTTGDGTDDPNGIVTASTVGGTGVGTGTTYGTYFGPTDLVSLFYKPAAPYRQVGNWLMNATTLAQVRNARTTAGEHIWQPSLQVGQPETILGRPVYENPAMANGSAAKSIIFGDTSRYIVARVVPIRVDSSIHYKFSTDQLALRTIERVDGDLVDAVSLYHLLNAAV
jgi:HK97 family phage major capsid protein